MDAPNTFGEKLRELRRKRGCSLQKVADRLAALRAAEGEEARGMNRSYISDLERGAKPPPSRRQVTRLAQALHCTDEERAELYVSAGFVPPSVAQAVPLPDRVHIAGSGAPASGPASMLAGPAAAPVVAEHDLSARLSPGGSAGPYQEGDLLLIRAVPALPDGAWAACHVGGKVCVRRCQRRGRSTALVAPDGQAEGAAAGRVEVLGQIVGVARLGG